MFTVGALIASLARYFAKLGFKRLLGLVGVPGTLGGGKYMTASCYGSGISDYLLDVTCVNGVGCILKEGFEGWLPNYDRNFLSVRAKAASISHRRRGRLTWFR